VRVETLNSNGNAQQIDVGSLREAVRSGAREGIEAHLRTLDPRQAFALVQAAKNYGQGRGGTRP